MVMSTTFEIRVAGINSYLSYQNKSNIGVKQGYCMIDPTNRYNSNAIAIYLSNGKLIGYIPNDSLEDFAEWSERKVIKCVGIICPFLGDYEDCKLFGRFTFYKGDDEEETARRLREEYQVELDSSLNDLNHKLDNLEQVSSLRSSNTQNNNNTLQDGDGCLGVVILGIVSILTAMFI